MRNLIVPISLLIVACSTQPAPRSPAEALYRRRCGNCHELHPAQAYSDLDWATNVQRMRANAGLTDAETQSLIAWLKATNER